MFRCRSTTYPPDEWLVRPIEDFGSYSLADPEARGMEVAILLAADPADEAAGNFQLLLSSKEAVTVRFPVVDVIPHPNFMNLEISATMKPGEAIRFLPNSQATPWMDFRDLVASQDIDITSSDGKLVSESFLEQLDKLGEGAIWRWFIAATSTGTGNSWLKKPNTRILNEVRLSRFCSGPYKLELRLQSLPITKDRAKSIPALQEDTAASMIVAKFEVFTRAFTGVVEGPVPILFSKDPAATIKWLKEDKDREAKMVMALYSRLIQPEALDAREAAAYINNPRPGHANHPLMDPINQQAKKRRVEAEDPLTNNINNQTGKNQNFAEHTLWPENWLLSSLCKTDQSSQLRQLVTNGIRPSTTKKYESAWHCFTQYLVATNQKLLFPVDRDVIRGFVFWAIDNRKLKANTVKSYLSAISFAHTVRGFDKNSNSIDGLVDLMLSGASNISTEKASVTKKRRAMSLPLLKILGHKVWESNLDQLKKQSIWAACCTAFFAAARMGELLSTNVTNFDPDSTLCWKDIRISDLHVLIHVKKPKNNKTGGEFLDVFCVPNESFCPVCALKVLKSIQIAKGLFDPNSPVFLIGKNRYLNKQFLNNFLKDVFKNICVDGKDDILCHSFRMAIPTAIMLTGSDHAVSNVKDWGRWASDCYKSYAKLQTGQKELIFRNITDILQPRDSNSVDTRAAQSCSYSCFSADI